MRCATAMLSLFALACSERAPESAPRRTAPQEELTKAPEQPRAEPEPDPTDEVTSASEREDMHAPHHEPSAPMEDELGVAAMVERNRARMRRDERAPVHVIRERDAIAAGRRICEAVVPARPANTPVLLKPNLSGFDSMRNGIDNGVELRTTGIDFLRGVVRCLRARGHREITITDAWSSADQRERWIRETGLDRLIAEENVRFVGLWEDRGEDGTLSPMVPAPYPGARHLRNELLVPRLLARHLQRGLYISIPRMKMHRYAVLSLSIKNTMGTVVLHGAEEPGSRSGRMHAEIGPWLTRWRNEHEDDRDGYIRSLELFAERIADVLEIELPDAVLIDGVPPVGGDGFQLTEPFDDGVAIGSVNPVLADVVAAEWLGYLDNEDLMREIRHPTSPLIEEAARRFYGSTDVLRDIPITGDASFREQPHIAHYRAFPGFEIGTPPRRLGDLPWIERALAARRIADEPEIDGVLDDAAWTSARAFTIDRDYTGRPSDLETIVRLAWNTDALFAAFDCAFEGELDLPADDAPIDREHESLYEHDVVELFVDSSPRSRESYREIELGPLGHFLDIDIDRDRRPRGDLAWSSGTTVRTQIDREANRFRIEARIPATAFGEGPIAAGEWRIGVYRIAGAAPERRFLARFPTYTERPNFHAPERFGWLRLIP
jgi:uncharacterized protein (DUF362 family)